MNQKILYDIFISYSRHDKDIVNKIVKLLQNKGYSVWIDKDGINSGEAFSGVITDAIVHSEIILFFSSKASNDSKWTRKEIFLSSEEGKTIIPIKLDTTRYNNQIRLLLSDLDYVDLSNPKNRSEGNEKLLRSVRQNLGENPDGNGSTKPNGGTPKPKPLGLYGQLIKNWYSRNWFINTFLIIYSLLLLTGLIFISNFGWEFIIVLLTGGIGVWLLLLNKEDGVTWIAGTSLLWTFLSAYNQSPSVVRFFQQSSFVEAWLPLFITCLTIGIIFLKNKKGKPWWRQCTKISLLGLIGLVLIGVIWIWMIAFDTYTRSGLPANLRYQIQNLF